MPATDTDRGDRRRWVVLILFCFYSASNAIQWITYAPIASTVKEFFDLTTNELNMLSSVYMIVFAAGAYFTCTTFERWGVRRGVLIGCVLNALGSILKVTPGLQVRGYATLITSQTLNSLSQLFVLSTPPLIAAQYFPPTKRAFATAVAATANNIGNAIALFVPPLIVRKGETKEFMALFCGEMALCCSILIGVFFFLKPPSYHAPSKALLAMTNKNNRGAVSHNTDEEMEDDDDVTVRTPTTNAHPDGSIQLPKKSHAAMGTTMSPVDYGSESKAKPLTWWQRLAQHEQMVTFVEVGHTVYCLCRRRDFVFLLCAFSISMGSVWTYASVLAQILEPFGVSATLAGIAGASNVVAGTVMAYLVGMWVDRTRHYKYPVLACLSGSVICCIGLMLVLLKVTPFSSTFNGLSVFMYVFAGLFQNTATPICFEFAMEITYPLPESVPGAMLMAGANIVSLIMLSVASAMLGNGEPTKKACVSVVVMITCVCAIGTVLAMVPRERLHRRDAEIFAKEQLAAMQDGENGPQQGTTACTMEPTDDVYDEEDRDVNGATPEQREEERVF